MRTDRKAQGLLSEASTILAEKMGELGGNGGRNGGRDGGRDSQSSFTGPTNPILQNALAQVNAKDASALLEQAGHAVNDKAARAVLLENLKNGSLDFLAKCLPSIQVPPITGVKDQIAYVHWFILRTDFWARGRRDGGVV